VRFSSALVGGLLAAVGFTAAQHLYVNFSVGVARYNALFGSFAFLPLLLAWIYLSWAIVLMGCEVTYANQHLARYRREALDRDLSNAEREALGLRMALGIARAFRDRAPPPSAVEIADRLDIAIGTVGSLVDNLESAGIVSACLREGEDQRFQLGRPAEEISVADVIAAVRGRRRARPEPPADLRGSTDRVVDALLVEMEGRVAGQRARTLAEMLAGPPEPSAASSA
jgi:membrane protein